MRFHRTNYDGPGKFDERETGTKAFDEAARHGANDLHGHSHHHEHEDNHSNADIRGNTVHDDGTTSNEVMEEETKKQMQQLLRARYDRRSGSYSRRGYTVGIGGPGKGIGIGGKTVFYFH